jgi:hypothetical protein
MPTPERLRDSTRIVVPCESLAGIRGDPEVDFAITVFATDGACRVIGRPTEIKDVGRFLARHGVNVA